jgi:cobyric acid synthase CobQ
MEVFTERERAQVAGFVVNRFRGKESLLGDAMELTRQHTGRPVLGVVPYLRDLGLPEEDSVGFKEGVYDHGGTGRLDIAVIDLPHISNFTDLDALRIEPDVCVRVVRSRAELGRPAALILPGSKNVPGDLRFLRETGLASAIEELAHAEGCEIVGICGGFQLLGQRIADPHGLESDGTDVRALGLLAVETTLAAEKTLRRTEARHNASGLIVRGYEIHHGVTRVDAAFAVLDPADGASSPDGLVWGCYLHGLFDEDEFRRWFLDRLRVRAGLAPLGAIQARYDIEPALDRVAAVVRERLPIDELYRRMGLR